MWIGFCFFLQWLDWVWVGFMFAEDAEGVFLGELGPHVFPFILSTANCHNTLFAATRSQSDALRNAYFRAQFARYFVNAVRKIDYFPRDWHALHCNLQKLPTLGDAIMKAVIQMYEDIKVISRSNCLSSHAELRASCLAAPLHHLDDTISDAYFSWPNEDVIFCP